MHCPTNTRAALLQRHSRKVFWRPRTRSISTIRYFVSSPVRVCGRLYKKRLREEEEAPRRSRARRRRSILWKDIRRRFQETRIVFRLGKLVIDTAVRELSRNFPLPAPPGVLVVLEGSTAIKTYLPELSMLTTSAALLPRLSLLPCVITRNVRKLAHFDVLRTNRKHAIHQMFP